MQMNTRVRKPTPAELEVLECHLLHHVDPEDHGYMIPDTHESFVTGVRSQPIAVVEYNDTGFADVKRTTLLANFDFIRLELTWENGVLRWVHELIPAPIAACPCARTSMRQSGVAGAPTKGAV